jgi:hypothetical protein
MSGDRSSGNQSWIKEWDSGDEDEDEDDSETDTRDKQRQAATASPQSIELIGSEEKPSPPPESPPSSPEVDDSAAFDLLLPDSDRVSPLQFHESVTGFALQEWNAPIVKGTKASGRKRGNNEPRSSNTRSRRASSERLSSRREESISKTDHITQSPKSPRARRRSGNNNNISKSDHDGKNKRGLKDESPSPKFNSRRSSSRDRERHNARASSRERSSRRHSEEKELPSKERAGRQHNNEKEPGTPRRSSSRERASRRHSNEKELATPRPSSRERARRNSNEKDLTSTMRSSSRERLSPRMARTQKLRAEIPSRETSRSPRPRRRAHSSERLASRQRQADRGQTDRRRARSKDQPLSSETRGTPDDVTRSPGGGRRKRAADRRHAQAPDGDKEGRSKTSPSMTEHKELNEGEAGERDVVLADYDYHAGSEAGPLHGAQLQFEGSTMDVVKAGAADEKGLRQMRTVASSSVDDPVAVDAHSKMKRPTTLRGMSRMVLERSSSISNLASKAIIFSTANKTEKAGLLDSIDDDIDSMAGESATEDKIVDHRADMAREANFDAHFPVASRTPVSAAQFDETANTLGNLQAPGKPQSSTTTLGEISVGTARRDFERSSSISNLASRALKYASAGKTEKKGLLGSCVEDGDGELFPEDIRGDEMVKMYDTAKNNESTENVGHSNTSDDRGSTGRTEQSGDMLNAAKTSARRVFERSSSISNFASRAIQYATAGKAEKKGLLEDVDEMSIQSEITAIKTLGEMSSDLPEETSKAAVDCGGASPFFDAAFPETQVEQPDQQDLEVFGTPSAHVFASSGTTTDFTADFPNGAKGYEASGGNTSDKFDSIIKGLATHSEKIHEECTTEEAKAEKTERFPERGNNNFPENEAEATFVVDNTLHDMSAGDDQKRFDLSVVDTKTQEESNQAGNPNREGDLHRENIATTSLPEQVGASQSATIGTESNDTLRSSCMGPAGSKEAENKKIGSPRKISLAHRSALSPIDRSDDRSAEALPESRAKGKTSKWKAISKSLNTTGEASDAKASEGVPSRSEDHSRSKISDRNDSTPTSKRHSNWDAPRNGSSCIEQAGRSSSEDRRRRRRTESAERKDEAKKERDPSAGNDHRSSSSDRRHSERSSQAKWAALKHGSAFIKNTEKRASESRRHRRRRRNEDESSRPRNDTKNSSSKNDAKADPSIAKASKWSALRAKVVGADEPTRTGGTGNLEGQVNRANPSTKGTGDINVDSRNGQSPALREHITGDETDKLSVASPDLRKSSNWNQLKARLGKTNDDATTERTEAKAAFQEARSPEDDEKDVTGRTDHQPSSKQKPSNWNQLKAGLGKIKDDSTGLVVEQNINMEMPVDRQKSSEGSRELDESSHWDQLKVGLGKINESQNSSSRERRVLRNSRGANKWAGLRHGQDFISQTKSASRRRRARSNKRGKEGDPSNSRPGHERRSRHTGNEGTNAGLEDTDPASDQVDGRGVADHGSRKQHTSSSGLNVKSKEDSLPETGKGEVAGVKEKTTVNNEGKVESEGTHIPRSFRKMALSSRWGNIGDLVTTSKISAEESLGSGANTEDTIGSQSAAGSGGGKNDPLSSSRHGQSSRKPSKWAMVKGGLAFISKTKQETEKKHEKETSDAVAEVAVDIVSAAQKHAAVFKKRSIP